jgi:hypothetical protein
MSKLIAGAMAAVIGVLASGSVAGAAAHHPKGEFAQFGNCPLSRKTITDCILSISNGGSFTVGERTVPITSPVTLTGGFEGVGERLKFFGADAGETLTKAPQTVPGGLEGATAPPSWPESLQKWLNEQIGDGATEVKATLELAAPATSIELNTEHLLNREGIALGLPAKFKIENPLLGDHCYIGSNSKPIPIDYTTGKSGRIEGSAGEFNFNKEFTLSTMTGGRLVSDTFSTPAARGCGGLLSVFINPWVNSLLGGVSPAGQSAAILEGKFQDAAASAVRASE